MRRHIPSNEQFDIQNQYRYGAAIHNICRWHNIDEAKVRKIIGNDYRSPLPKRPQTVLAGFIACLNERGYVAHSGGHWHKHRGPVYYSISINGTKLSILEDEGREGWYRSTHRLTFKNITVIP